MSDDQTSKAVNASKVQANSSSEPAVLHHKHSNNVCELPGWSYSEFTRSGKIGVWNISHMMESGRLFLPPLFTDSTHPAKEVHLMGVVSAQKTEVSRNLHRFATLHLPMLYTRKIGYVGKTSFSLIFELWHKETGTCLVQNERQLVFIGKKTHKAQPLPKYLENIRDQYPKYDFIIKVNRKPADPMKFYLATFKIVASDMDKYYHTNQSTYYRFALDAAYEAWKNGFLHNFTVDPCEYEVKSYKGKHTVETFAGDVISVAVWEDEFHKTTLHFEVCKVLDNAYVMYQKMVFFPLIGAKL